MPRTRHRARQLAVREHLRRSLALADQPASASVSFVTSVPSMSQVVEPHDLILFTERIREAALGKPTRERHLAALEVRLAAARAMVPRARLDPLCPLPDVLPVPEPGPRPSRLRFRCEPECRIRLCRPIFSTVGSPVLFRRHVPTPSPASLHQVTHVLDLLRAATGNPASPRRPDDACRPIAFSVHACATSGRCRSAPA